MDSSASSKATGATHRVAYLGPAGTFTEQALHREADLSGAELIECDSMVDALFAVEEGDADLCVVPIENAIEGTVNATIDTLAFDVNLRIQRELVEPVALNLLALPGSEPASIKTLHSIPVAAAQCRTWLRGNLGGVEQIAAKSTAEAAQSVAQTADPTVAAIANRRAAEVYGLDIVAADIEDHSENHTRFVVVGRDAIPAATGHDKTSILVYQSADRPGSLLGILQEFAARGINLTLLLSRPTKKSLGDYCFLLDLEGHVSDEVVADCLASLKATQGDVKFLGSYPAAGSEGPSRRAAFGAKAAEANDWIRSIRDDIARG